MTVRKGSHSPVRALFHFSDHLLVMQSRVGGRFFDMRISPTEFIKEILGHYGKITLSDINNQSEIINATNARREKEYEKIYTCPISSLPTESRNTFNHQ